MKFQRDHSFTEKITFICGYSTGILCHADLELKPVCIYLCTRIMHVIVYKGVISEICHLLSIYFADGAKTESESQINGE